MLHRRRTVRGREQRKEKSRWKEEEEKDRKWQNCTSN